MRQSALQYCKEKHTKRFRNTMKDILVKIFLQLQKIFIYLSNKIKHMGNSFTEIKFRELQARPLLKGFNSFCKISPLWIMLALAVDSLIGFFIIYFANSFEKYWLHIVCITFCMSLTIIIGRKFIRIITLLDDEINEKNTLDNVELKTNYNRFKNYAFHRGNLLFCVVIPCIFFWSIFKQKYLKFDIVGIYGIIVISATLFMSILGYVEYMWILWLLYRIAHCEHFYYNKSNPSQTPFLIYIADITNCAKWFFLVESFIYIFEYFILIPRRNLIAGKIQMPDNLSFFVTWIILLIVLVIAFPIIVLIQETLISKIIDNLKQEQIQAFSICFNIANSNEGIEQAYMCNSIIANIISSSDYPIRTQRFGPALISLATFALHTVNLLTQIPEIHNLISQFL